MKFAQPKILATTLLMILTSASAFAGQAPDSTFPKPQNVPNTLRPTVGLLGGYAEQNGSVHSAIAYGATFDFQPLVPFSFGLEFTHFYGSKDMPVNQSDSFYRNALLAKVTYNLGGELPVIRNTYVGVKAGAVFDKEDIFNATNATAEISRTRFAFAPVIGMDFMMSEKVSLGGQFSYLFTVGPEVAYNTFNALADVKYWF